MGGAHLVHSKMFLTLFLKRSDAHLFWAAAICAVTPSNAHKLQRMLLCVRMFLGNEHIGHAVARACLFFQSSEAQLNSSPNALAKELRRPITEIEKVHNRLTNHSKLPHWQDQKCRQILITEFGEFFKPKGCKIKVEETMDGLRFRCIGSGDRYELSIFCSFHKVYARILCLADDRSK